MANLIISEAELRKIHELLESVNPEEMANTQAFKIGDAMARLELLIENAPTTIKKSIKEIRSQKLFHK